MIGLEKIISEVALTEIAGFGGKEESAFNQKIYGGMKL